MIEITGAVIAAARKTAELSREKFAQQTGLSPGAVWRIEAKNQFKAGEVALLAAWLEGKVLAPSTHPSPQQKLLTVVDADPPSTDRTGDTSALVGVTGWNPELLVQPTPAPPRVFPSLPELAGSEESPTAMSLRDGRWRVSNSEVQTYKRCKRKWWFAYYRKLQPKHETQVGARAVGDRLHRALRFAYLADGTQRMDPRDALEALIEYDRRALSSTVAGSDWEDDVRREQILAQFEKEADLERVMIAGYVEWLAETGVDSELEITGSEVYLEAELPDMPHVLIIARLDARVRRIVDGVRLFIDHKTVGDFTQPARTLHMDEQMMMYMLIERLQGDDSPVAGALYNMLKRSKRTQKATPPFYKRIEVHHNSTTLANFQQRLTGTLIDITETRHKLDQGVSHRQAAYPTPKRDCTWECPFFTACGMTDDGSYAEGLVKQFFTENGDPLAYYAKQPITLSDKANPGIG